MTAEGGLITLLDAVKNLITAINSGRKGGTNSVLPDLLSVEPNQHFNTPFVADIEQQLRVFC